MTIRIPVAESDCIPLVKGMQFGLTYVYSASKGIEKFYLIPLL